MTEAAPLWTVEALCAGISNPNIFFSDDPKEKAQAKSLCFSCPVRQTCLQEALDRGEHHGTWGGAHEQELRKVLAVDAKGKPFVHANRPIRCPFCGPRSTKYLTVRERKRTRTHVECSNCGTHWWTKKTINKTADNW